MKGKSLTQFLCFRKIKIIWHTVNDELSAQGTYLKFYLDRGRLFGRGQLIRQVRLLDMGHLFCHLRYAREYNLIPSGIHHFFTTVLIIMEIPKITLFKILISLRL